VSAIARGIHRLRYFCADAWDEWRHSPGVNVLALATLAAALCVAGAFGLILANLDRQAAQLRSDMRVSVYLVDDHDAAERAGLAEELRGLDGVASVEHVDKDEALRRYRAWAADMAELVSDLESNPLPASLEVLVAPGADAATTATDVARLVEGRRAVEEVRYDRDWLVRLEAILDLARAGGLGIALPVFLAVAFVMASVLRLAVYARRDEIDIMLLVGATPWFVRGPFLVAGFVQGLVAAVAAVGTIEVVRRLGLDWAGARASEIVALVAARPLPWAMCVALVVAGVSVGLVGSWFAVRRPFDVAK
jgi:cell division transport system permease protein